MKQFVFALIASSAIATSAFAQVSVSNAWVRATVPVQKSSGAFMVLRSAQPARLVGVSSPVAASVELHKSAMQDGMMSMDHVDAIDLPAGQDVNLAGGGYHVMLIGLKRQLKQGETVPLTLQVKRGAATENVTVQAAVKPITFKGD